MHLLTSAICILQVISHLPTCNFCAQMKYLWYHFYQMWHSVMFALHNSLQSWLDTVKVLTCWKRRAFRSDYQVNRQFLNYIHFNIWASGKGPSEVMIHWGWSKSRAASLLIWFCKVIKFMTQSVMCGWYTVIMVKFTMTIQLIISTINLTRFDGMIIFGAHQCEYGDSPSH